MLSEHAFLVPRIASSFLLQVFSSLAMICSSATLHSSFLVFILLLLHHAHSSHSTTLAQTSSSWQTLSGSAPLVIARGGSSGLFPDQTVPAYLDALNNSLSSIALMCDLQLTKDAKSICRTGLDLSNSTNINQTTSTGEKQYIVNGKIIQGFFAIDYTAAEILALNATQPILTRTNVFDAVYGILQLEYVDALAKNTGFPYWLWVNVEYPSFFAEHKLDMATYLTSEMNSATIQYVSSPEVAFLKSIQAAATKRKTKLIFKFLNQGDVDPSTNATYGSLLTNLKAIKSFASGILVPKAYIWPVDSQTLYLQSQTSLVQDARSVGLEVHVYGFVNDLVSPIYNYSFDPIQEYLSFVSTSAVAVDGVMTDFPTTASEAIACYSSAGSSTSSKLATKAGKPLVISHNGASGDFPGCTLLAYEGAIKDGADYIDCPVQITKDGVPICLEFADLLKTTDISLNTKFFPSMQSSISQFQSAKGIFTVNMTMDEIKTLKAMMYSPEGAYGVFRNAAFDGTQDIMTLSEFLTFASQNGSGSGILIDVQNAYFIETALHLDVVGSIISALDAAGYTNSSRVLVQSEDSAVLKRFQQLTPYTLVYTVPDTDYSISKEIVQQIKQTASIVALPRALVEPGNMLGFLENPTNVVAEFKAQNMTVFIYFLRNEFVAQAFDYEADPTLELNTVLQYFKVDGIITDFPRTATAYLGNECLNLRTEVSGLAYLLHLVTPGGLMSVVPPNLDPPAPGPYPPLNVTEAALPPFVATTGAQAPSPTSAVPPSSLVKKSSASVPSPFLFTSSIILVSMLYFLAF